MFKKIDSRTLYIPDDGKEYTVTTSPIDTTGHDLVVWMEDGELKYSSPEDFEDTRC